MQFYIYVLRVRAEWYQNVHTTLFLYILLLVLLDTFANKFRWDSPWPGAGDVAWLQPPL